MELDEPVPVELDDGVAVSLPVPVELGKPVPVELGEPVPVELDEPVPVSLSVPVELDEPVPVELDDGVPLDEPVAGGEGDLVCDDDRVGVIVGWAMHGSAPAAAQSTNRRRLYMHMGCRKADGRGGGISGIISGASVSQQPTRGRPQAASDAPPPACSPSR